MRLLALDAATESCSVALLTPSGVLERVAESGKAHAEHLIAMVSELLAENIKGGSGSGINKCCFLL